MPDLVLATQIASIVSAIASAMQLSISYRQAEKNLDKRTIAKHAQILISTYDDDELSAIHDRIRTCRDRFINEGGGVQRVRCMCSVLRDAIAGNGGVPPIPEWERMYDQLCQ